MATNTYVALDKVTLTSNASDVTFSSIPSGYTDLVVVVMGASTTAGSSTNGLRWQINGDTSSNYSETQIYGDGSTATSTRGTNATDIGAGLLMQTSAGYFATNIISFMNYSNTTTYKTILTRNGGASVSTAANVALWRSTSAITSIKFYRLTDQLKSGSTFSLYGIKAQATPGTAKATGGTITYDNFGRVIHTFTSSGTFTPSVPLTCDYLVVAGGGGSGTSRGGGGGAGGLYSTVSNSGGGGGPQTPINVGASAYTITVGAGGAGAISGTGARGSNGQSSSIAGSGITTITLTGGGGGGGSSDINGSSGGSGGGGRQNSSSSGGSGTSNQGYAGGNSASGNGGGGGGGAGAVGSNGNSVGTPGNGGAGVSVAITGSSVAYAGGGAGGGEDGKTATGGTGGGGNTANAGTANTGGGGGGPNTDTASSPGFNGGSGIVIIRYQG